MITEDHKLIFVIMPAYNCAKTLLRTLEEVPLEYRNHVLLVDDASQDNTVEIAQQAGLRVIRHEKTRVMELTKRPAISML